jgi:hypothetical protein
MKNPEYNSSFHSDLYKKLKAGEISEKEWANYCLQYLRKILEEKYPKNLNKNE